MNLADTVVGKFSLVDLDVKYATPLQTVDLKANKHQNISKAIVVQDLTQSK